MDNSNAENTARLRDVAGRPALLVSVLTVVMLAITVSCGGGDDNSNSGDENDEERTYTIQTFTPTVPGSTPEALVTRDARQTAAAVSATEIARNPPEVPATMTPGGPLDEAGGIRPPVVSLNADSGQMDGVFGSYGWIDEESESYVLIQAPFYDVGDNGLTVPAGGDMTFNILDEVDPPSEVNVSIFTWDENSAIPTDTEGNVGAHPWFAPRVAPVSTESFTAADPTFTMPDEPDRYVVQVEVRWPPDDRLDLVQQPIFASYAFTVYVS